MVYQKGQISPIHREAQGGNKKASMGKSPICGWAALEGFAFALHGLGPAAEAVPLLSLLCHQRATTIIAVPLPSSPRHHHHHLDITVPLPSLLCHCSHCHATTIITMPSPSSLCHCHHCYDTAAVATPSPCHCHHCCLHATTIMAMLLPSLLCHCCHCHTKAVVPCHFTHGSGAQSVTHLNSHSIFKL